MSCLLKYLFIFSMDMNSKVSFRSIAAFLEVAGLRKNLYPFVKMFGVDAVLDGAFSSNVSL